MIASGARARRVAGHGQRGERVLRSLADAVELRQACLGARTVAILGGGFLGMEMASSLRASGSAVTVVDVAPPLLRQLGPDLAALFVAAARDAGVRIVVCPAGAGLRCRTDIGAGAFVDGIALGDGRQLTADVVITAVGDIPNTEWLAGSGIASRGPLVVTADGWVTDGVVAAGDVSARADPLTGQLVRTPHWHAAIGQGRRAARALLHGGGATPVPGAAGTALDDVPYVWTEGFGLEVKIAGTIPPDVAPIPTSGALGDRRAVLQWWRGEHPVAAATVNHKLPVARLKRLATRNAELVSPRSGRLS